MTTLSVGAGAPLTRLSESVPLSVSCGRRPAAPLACSALCVLIGVGPVELEVERQLVSVPGGHRLASVLGFSGV